MGGKSDKTMVKPTAAGDQDQDGPRARPSRLLHDWTYHGTGPVMSADDRAHILVEDAESDPAGRQGAAVLRELAEPADGGFGWGHNGTGPLRAAAAILADALSPGDPADRGTDPFPPRPDTTLTTLRGDFTWDVTSQLCEEWRLRRGAVLRWVRDWYAEHGITGLPAAAAQLPPISLHPPASADRTGPYS